MFFLYELHYYSMRQIERCLMSSPVFSPKYYLFWIQQNKGIMRLMELFYKTIILTWNIFKL